MSTICADYAVFGASNSGQTKEVISLFTKLVDEGHPKRFGLTANTGTRLEAVSNRCYMLSCGKEDAVAATKSVVEQALFYRSLLRPFAQGECPHGDEPAAGRRRRPGDARNASSIRRSSRRSPARRSIYFAGRNNGVAEELTLKTNEITRKKSDYLEGTYAVHGIEEVMEPDDVVLVVDPFPAEVEKFKETLVDGVGMTVIADRRRGDDLPDDPHPDGRGLRDGAAIAGRLEHVGPRGRGHWASISTSRRGRGRSATSSWANASVGWAEWSESHQSHIRDVLVGLAPLGPPYGSEGRLRGQRMARGIAYYRRGPLAGH